MDARAEELLGAIARNPDDNEPRLAFAKHIEAEAPAHAALIVAQCRSWDGDGGRRSWDGVRHKLYKLLSEYRTGTCATCA